MADELERALLLRDLELMGQPRNPNAVQPGRAGLLDVGVGLPERLSLLNQIFNPVEAIGQSMNAGERMMSPNMGVMDRLAALGDMASGIAGVVAPVAAASRAGTPAATALMEGLLGWSPTREAAGDTARAVGRDIVERLNQPGQMPTVYSNPIPGLLADYGRPPLDVSRRDASNIFGAGSERVRYTDPRSGGTIEVVVRPDGSASVLELEVPEASRGQGIGQTLQERVMQDFPIMGGQVSSKAAATTAYRLGRRPPGKPYATLEEVFADIDEMSSVNMISPAMQERLTPQAPAAPSSFRLYHGSPHDFDRFSMSKIGTGEGNQAYGHGLYFAENEGIARGYRDALVDARIPALNDRLSEIAREIANISSGYRQWKPGAEEAGKALSAEYDALMDARSKMKGHMYEVQVNANPEDFLDWDKPFASADDVERFAARFDAVDPALRKRIEDFGYMRQQMGQPMPDGNDIIREVMGGIGSKDAARASETMREAGIPGIRYLDAGSRGAGDGSRNYVIFDENLINIVRKYGIAGAAAMLGVSAFDVEQAMAQGQQQPQGLLSTGVQ